MMTLLIILFVTSLSQAQPSTSALERYSEKINKSLPAIYDSITKLQKTSVDHGKINYHFIVNADQKDFDRTLPKVKSQVLKTICNKPQESFLLKNLRASIVYTYENVKGQLLGQFMVNPDFCN